jgi:hypothetical protein
MGVRIIGIVNLKIISISFLLSIIVLIATTPIHEGVHWIISDIEPYSDPIEIRIFQNQANPIEQNILSSAFGYTKIKESYQGSFNDRPTWLYVSEELICIFIQMIITCIFVYETILFIIDKNIISNKSK